MKLIWMMAINRMIPFGWFFEGFSDHLQANFGWFCHILPYLNPPVGSEIWIPSGGSRYIDVHPGKRTWQWRNKPFEDVSPMKNGNDFQPMTWESHEWTENNSLLQWSFEGVFGCRTAIKWYAYMIFTNIVSFDFVQRYRKIYIYIWYYVHSYFTSRSSSKHQFGGILKLRQRSPQTLSSDARMEFKTAVANLGWTEFFGERYAIGEMGRIFCPDLKRQENPRWLPLDPKTKVAVSYSRWCFQRFLLAILNQKTSYLVVKWSNLTSIFCKWAVEITSEWS